MGASLPLPLLPPRILSVLGVKSKGCGAKKRKKTGKKGVQESSESLSLLLSPQSAEQRKEKKREKRESRRAANLFLFFCLLNFPLLSHFRFRLLRCPASLGVANGTLKNVGLGKFWQDLEISKAFLTRVENSFLHGLFYFF